MVLEGTWTQTYGTFSFVCTITGSYTASGSAIALGEPDVKIQYAQSGDTLADYTDKDSVEAIETIIENISLAYSNGGLVIDFSALDEYIAQD